MPEHTGKGAFCLQLIAYLQAQDPDFVALWTDAESAFDTDWAVRVGVDLDRLFIQTYSKERDTMEAILQDGLNLIKDSEGIDLWIVDSIGGLYPKGDAKKTLEGDSMLWLQRKLGEFFRKANVIIAPRKEYDGCAVVMIGQVYDVPSTMSVGLKEVRGGNALKHWAHLRLAFRRGPKIDWPVKIKVQCPDGKQRDLHPGWSGRIKIEKTRINEREGQEILIRFYLGRGFDSKEATINAAIGLGLIVQGGGGYFTNSLLPEGKIRGKESVFEFFKKHEQEYKQLFDLVNISCLEEHVVAEKESDKLDEQCSI